MGVLTAAFEVFLIVFQGFLLKLLAAAIVGIADVGLVFQQAWPQ